MAFFRFIFALIEKHIVPRCSLLSTVCYTFCNHRSDSNVFFCFEILWSNEISRNAFCANIKAWKAPPEKMLIDVRAFQCLSYAVCDINEFVVMRILHWSANWPAEFRGLFIAIPTDKVMLCVWNVLHKTNPIHFKSNFSEIASGCTYISEVEMATLSMPLVEYYQC